MVTMLDYIQEEQETLSTIITKYRYQKNAKLTKAKHLLILATGSSYNACLAAKVFFEKVSGTTVTIEEPYHFQHYGKLPEAVDGVIAVSQSGKSASTIDALRNLQKRVRVQIVLTSDATSPIAQLSDYVIDLGMGIEQVGFVTKGYVATVLQLMLLGMTIGASKDKLTEAEVNDYQMQLQHLVAHIPTVIENSQLFFEKNEAIFRLTTRFIGIGYGSNWGTVKEFETKFTETIRKPSSGFELEAYMHGPYLEADAEHLLFFVENNSVNAQRSRKLREYMSQYVGHTMTITTEEVSDEQTLSLNIEIDESLTPLILVIPFQLFAYQTATAKGIDLSRRIFDDFDQVLKSKV
jgi:glucoselysine-6-phosphate deglycase